MKWLWCVVAGVAMSVTGTPISEETAMERAFSWMESNPVMLKASRSVASVETFPDLGSYSVYVVQLSPKGYLILNSDDRLPLTVSFSPESTVNLTDDPQNALRSMLIDYCAQRAEELADWNPVQSSLGIQSVVEDELYGPFLATSWGQNEPYNNFCPSGAPVGCVPVTYAQLMSYHRWPYYGSGSRYYIDSSGSNTGTHSADFSSAYHWENMQAAHSASDSPESLDAVAELMYELGVAAGVNYEAGGTSGNSTILGSCLGEYAYYGTISSHESDDGNDIITPMEADLRAGFPCVVSYPGHAFIADGLMVDGGSTTYHFNMGWGGYNNGWYTADTAPTGSGSTELDGSITSFRPQLMAFPQTNAVSAEAGGTAEVRWIMPKRLEGQVSKLTVKQLAKQSGNWSSDASEITGLSSGWKVSSNGRSGDCWYGGDYGCFSMVLKEVVVPNASSQFTFWMKYLLADDLFTVSVSSDGGATYAVVLSEEKQNGSQNWRQESVSLAAFAGQEISIKISLRVDGLYYPNGGVWLDDLAVSSGEWYDWTTLTVDTTLASRRFSEATIKLDDCDDFSVFEVTTQNSTYAGNWAVNNVSGVGNCFYKPSPEYPECLYHITSRSTIIPTSATRLLLHTKYSLQNEIFRVLISTDRSSFSEIWSTGGVAGWHDLFIDLSTYAGLPIYVRVEYVGTGNGWSDGGIWIDSISTQEVTNPELEGQPVHYTALDNLPAGNHTLAAVLTDTNGVEHAVGPAFTLAVSGSPDDGDGIPEFWEVMYGLNPGVDDGGLDPDGDGFSNWQEYIAGTVPTNRASSFRLVFSSGTLPLFEGMSGRRYRVEYCDGLVTNGWQELVANVTGSDDWIDISQYDDATNGCRFYRVQVQLSE